MTETKKNSPDVWSLGIIIYELLYNKFPFQIDSETGKYDKKEAQEFCNGKR